MSAGDRLTESIRVRLAVDEKRELEASASAEARTASAVARRAIRRELDRLAKARRRER